MACFPKPVKQCKVQEAGVSFQVRKTWKTTYPVSLMEKEKLNLMSSVFHFMYLQRAETNIVYVQAPSFLLLVQI